MADKSVIQMRRSDHDSFAAQCCELWVQIEEAGRDMPLTDAEKWTARDAFQASWSMATKSILRNGNCKFEAE